MNEILRRTPLYDEFKARGGKLVPFAGYEMPVQFGGILKEHHSVRNAVGLFDVSHMGEIWLRGKDAVAYADTLVTNDVSSAAEGRVIYSPMCLPSGGIVDDLLVYRIAPEEVLLVVNASNREKDLAHIQANRRGDVAVVDESISTGQLAIQGPRAVDVLASLTDGRFKDLGYFHCIKGEVAQIPCLVSRTGYTGEDGYELYCPADRLVALFHAVLRAGEPYELALIGLGARDTLRLEARLSLYGNDIDETTSPLEAGLGWTVKLEAGDFIGRGALIQQKAEGLRRRLVGFEMRDRGIARHGYDVVRAGDTADAAPVGAVCSGAPSPTLGKSIGLAYLPKALTRKGTEFGVVIRGKVKRAEVVKTPFYTRNS